MKIYNYLLNIIETKGAVFLVLIDPDKINRSELPAFIYNCEKSGVDAFLIGGSLILENDFELYLETVKTATNLPAIIFPGAVTQVTKLADAILFISVISGRNPEHLIGRHVLSAPLIKKCGLEPISTGYIIVESGQRTTAEYMSGSLPVPRKKSEIAAATALAAEYFGMKFVYLEAGSGAELTVPFEMVKAVSSVCSIPIIVGGGIKDPNTAREMVNNGAKVIVVGNFFENKTNHNLIKLFADAVHIKLPVSV
jgi:putative glycerol-1-phosphate prenyltransferase